LKLSIAQSKGSQRSLSGEARLVAYNCKSGIFSVTLLIKQAEAVDISMNGKPIRHLEFPGATTWHGDLPVPEQAGGTCMLSVKPTGLAGLTVFEYHRG